MPAVHRRPARTSQPNSDTRPPHSAASQTRSKLLQQKPSHKNNWMALAVANQMNSSNKQAISVVDAFIGTQDAKARQRDYGEWSANMSTTAAAAASQPSTTNHQQRRSIPPQTRAS